MKRACVMQRKRMRKHERREENDEEDRRAVQKVFKAFSLAVPEEIGKENEAPKSPTDVKKKKARGG